MKATTKTTVVATVWQGAGDNESTDGATIQQGAGTNRLLNFRPEACRKNKQGTVLALAREIAGDAQIDGGGLERTCVTRFPSREQRAQQGRHQPNNAPTAQLTPYTALTLTSDLVLTSLWNFGVGQTGGRLRETCSVNPP